MSNFFKETLSNKLMIQDLIHILQTPFLKFLIPKKLHKLLKIVLIII